MTEAGKKTWRRPTLPLDMDWRWGHFASDKGLMCCINTDAHSINHLQFFHAGVNTARKGWLKAKDILNTRTLKQVQKMLRDFTLNH